MIVGTMVAAAVTALLTGPVIHWLKRRAVLDVPVERSSHTDPTPRGGGIAPSVGACAGAVLVAGAGARPVLGVMGVALAYGLLGFREDLIGISPLARLATQMVIAGGGVIVLLWGEVEGLMVFVLVVGATLWLAAFVNAFNFMDGINGISTAQAALAGAAWALIGWWEDERALVAIGSIVAASAVAFLPFNFPRARVFLGDVGSYFLGGWLGAAVVVGLTAGVAPEAMVAPLALYLADTGTTLLRRAARRAPLTEPHRDHVYQQMVIGGWTHTRATIAVGTGIAMCAVLGAFTTTGSVSVRVAADIALVGVLVAYLLLPRWLRRRETVSSRPAVEGEHL